MGPFIARRLLALIPLLLIISFAVFAITVLLPGDPAREIAGGLDAPEDKVDEIREELGFDDPVLVQYGRWLQGAFTGDLGESVYSGRTVASELSARFPVTLNLAVGAVLISMLIGIPAGVAAGTRPGSAIDRVVGFGSSLGVAIPDFFLATALVVLFAVERNWFPSIGYVDFSESPVAWFKSLFLPWISLGLGASASLARQVRGAMIDVLDQDYVRTARAKGLRERQVLAKHALKNALTPALTIVGIQFAYLLGGTVIIEQIFAIPGLGQYFLEAIIATDIPVIQGVTLLLAVVFVVMNLLVDVLYGVVNPKVRVT